MKIYIENFIRLRKELKVLLYLSLVIIVSIQFIFHNFFEVTSSIDKIGIILLNLSYSYISALIFYFLVVHHERQNEKRKFYSIIRSILTSLIQSRDNIYTELWSC